MFGFFEQIKINTDGITFPDTRKPPSSTAALFDLPHISHADLGAKPAGAVRLRGAFATARSG